MCKTTLEVIEKTREYLDYLEDHIKRVNAAWEKIVESCKDMRFIYDDFFFFSINDSIKSHDLSKLSKEEFVPYRRKFYPTENEEVLFKDNIEEAFVEAFEYHKEKNQHHWETINGKDIHAEINYVHMVADWMAMSDKLGGTPKEYYEKNKKKINLPSWAEVLVLEIMKKVHVDHAGSLASEECMTLGKHIVVRDKK